MNIKVGDILLNEWASILFIFEPMANEQFAKNMVRYYGGVKDENNQ